MTKEDLEVLRRLAPHLTDLRSVGVFSPLRDGERKVFPKATALSSWQWNLDKPSRRRFDLLVAANVFMYSHDPARWFRNVLASCRYFLMLDLVRRKRAPNSELGADRDSMRYAIGEAKTRGEPQFDLNSLGDRLLGYRTFDGGANEYDDAPLHVLALFRGDLADPILRIDDYPTGVRPVLDDMTPLHEILRKVERRGLHYYLSIVPGLLNAEMLSFLGELEHMIPAVHGYDHAYPKYAPVLIAKGDPFNQGTVGTFNEFQGLSYDVVLGRLREGRRLLHERLGKPVEAYVPPCNRGDRQTSRALVEAGYRSYLSEKALPGCPLPWIRSDFYGRSNAYDDARRPDIITLHLTWEWDLVREGKSLPLDRLLDDLGERKRAERERGQRLGAIVGAGNGTLVRTLEGSGHGH